MVTQGAVQLNRKFETLKLITHLIDKTFVVRRFRSFTDSILQRRKLIRTQLFPLGILRLQFINRRHRIAVNFIKFVEYFDIYKAKMVYVAKLINKK